MQKQLLELCGTIDRLELLFRGGGVARYHSEPSMHKQSVAEHSWRVMVLLLHFWPQCPARTLKAALFHDVSEGYHGDVPAPVKRVPSLRAHYDDMEKAFLEHVGLTEHFDLPAAENARLKVCDYLELCITCKAQQGRAPARVFTNGYRYVAELLNGPLRSDPMINTLVEFLARVSKGEFYG